HLGRALVGSSPWKGARCAPYGAQTILKIPAWPRHHTFTIVKIMNQKTIKSKFSLLHGYFAILNTFTVSGAWETAQQ
ncbi:MAG TPA: hypothetical protein DCZ48_08235, partial [Methylococcaceae bacterium]|nr:hypothetical protein [Methylococcaceae bacterium]